MPDFANTEVKGVAVGAVTVGGPAEHGGIHKGDVITALNGKPVENIYDYMDRLKTFTSGQTISVDVLRGKDRKVLLIQL
jgi:serine protease Do